MQNSVFRGGNREFERAARSKGTLFIKNDRSNSVVSLLSLRKIAFARTSNDARIRSMQVFWTSP
jgi:hypothetical protein